ncbi:MAG TPA: long-chain-acyl-CoA synthetase [Caulobacterales bacterium]|nr:long-chain-acyl-CoA synthetase [Caulobacterales bacterium]
MGLWSAVAREIKFLHALLRTLGRVRIIDSRPDWLMCDAFEAAADRWADNEALKSEDGALTYRQFDDLANGAARWAAAQGLQRGDCVAIVLPNRLDYVPLWLGLSKLGVIGALVNNNLAGEALAHCLQISGARHIISDATCAAALEAIGAERRARIWMLEPTLYGAHLRLERDAPRPARQVRAGMNNKNTALLIFTSGTTGLPKAARITHARALLYTLGFAGSTGARATDRIYCALPLYHATAGLAALGAAALNGACFVIRRKFSASQFWDDVRGERCTMFVYIGELCRYLLNQPAHPHERAHKLRLAFGNGLRPEIWTPFQTRFGVPNILEFYGSTEGNVSLFNFDGRTGAVGRVPFYVRNQFNVRLVKLDLETEQPIRGPDGLAQECAPGEIGETIGKIGAGARTNYTGYVDRAASEKKIMRDVFAKGDAWFRTGDLMRQDKDGYFYFVDRLGDTFRWKGENVSTTEVAAALSSCPGVAEANVYGVAVPGHEGRAGMAAVITKAGFDLEKLRAGIEAKLPAYARPLFIRLQPEIETTGTFKYRKIDLVRAGFDPGAIADPLYFNDAQSQQMAALTPALYAEIASGRVRL